MIQFQLSSLPLILSAIRFIAGPVYLLFGVAPASASQLALLIVVALTDLADGPLARSLRATSSFGAGLDTTADKVFVLSLLLKLMLVGRLPGWVFYAICVEFAVLAVEGSIYVHRFGTIPVPDVVAKASALLAFVTVIAGVSLASTRPLLMLSLLTLGANAIHLVTAFIRITSDTGELR